MAAAHLETPDLRADAGGYSCAPSTVEELGFIGDAQQDQSGVKLRY